MNKPFFHLLPSLLICLTLPLTATAQVVSIPDSNLRTKIEEALGKASGATITTSDMARLTHLEAGNANITNLAGLELATNLQRLDLGYAKVGDEWKNSNAVKDLSSLAGLTQLTFLHLPGNSVSDISPLADLTNLTWLNLWGNSVSSLSAVEGLTKLTDLWLGGNNITDISPLAGLTNLTELELFGNQITDISPLSRLTHLETLGLANNSISDISPLASLTNLERLGLRHNFISDISLLADFTKLARVDLRHNYIRDISPLVANTGLGNEDEVVLNNNPLSVVSIKTHVPALQSRSVIVEFDDTTHLNVGEPRTVRMIYFLPNDQSYRSAVVQGMKSEMRLVQTFFAEQMAAHGYGQLTFDVETDAYGEPMVHRVDGQYGDSRYHADRFHTTALTEVEAMFNFYQNVYVIVVGLSGEGTHGGEGNRWGKNGGVVTVPDDFDGHWQGLAHELGHAFGLDHDFRDGVYLLSYGPGPSDRLSACHAEYLSVHPYFNPDIPIEIGPPPTIELISPQRIYPAGAKSILIRFRISDSDGLHQWLLHAWQPHVKNSVLTCGTGGGVQELMIDFDYDGVIPSAHDPEYSRNTSLNNPLAHPIRIEVVDVNGNVSSPEFPLFSEAFAPLSKISGDNQRGVPNIPLAVPFVVELRSSGNGWGQRGVPITFTVTAGGGTLSVTHTTTDTTPWKAGRAESILTLGPDLGTNTVEVSAAGIEGTVTFTAVAGASVDIPDPNLRAAIEDALGVTPGTPITPVLTRLEARNANISDLTGLQHAIHLRYLNLSRELVGGKWVNSNSVSNLSPLSGLTSLTDLWLESNAITDISPLAGLVNLVELQLGGNTITDISPVAGLTNLTWLGLWVNNISDISALAGLTRLTALWLGYNTISDLSPLVANTGLGSGDRVYVRGNPLSYLSIHTHIPVLQNRGVTIEFDNRAHPALLKISGDNQKGAAFTPLPQPFIVEAQDANGSALVGVSVRFAVTAGGGALSTITTRTDENGRAQTTLTLGPNLGKNTVSVSATGIEVPATFHAVSNTEAPPISADVNNDGVVNVLDLVVITSNLDTKGTNLAADVNRDGIVNILDLVLAAGMFDRAAAAPSAQSQIPEALTAVEVQGWLTDARALEVRDPIMKRGIMVLEQLLVSLTPKETELLSNYPNPFNPETWIPYRLAEDAFVTLTIYDTVGQVVRTLEVGHRIASAYENRSKAIYWDGGNDVGELVASGVYFYTLTTGDYSATRRMVILK